MSSLTIDQFRGGLVKNQTTTLKDNEFAELTNFFYNESKRPQTCRGRKNFGQPIADAVTLINALDATTDITATDDATNLITGTAIRGSNSVSFDIVVATTADNFATVTWAGASTVDISGSKGYITLWFKPVAGFNTNLTDVKFHLGSDSSNYYEWKFPTLTVNANNFIVLTFANATTVGTPVDTAIDYFRLRVTYTGAYTNKLGNLIDSIYAYSATSTKPTTSYFYHKFDNLTRRALCVAGTNMFQHDEASEYWEVINTGLTEFETAVGLTTNRTRWSFTVYKDIVYMCNGVDSYRSWNGTAITTYGAQPKPRFLTFSADRVFGFGAYAAPSTLYYIAAAAADAATLNANALIVGGDTQGKGTGLMELGQVILAGKSNRIYSINLATPSALPVDAESGLYGHRALALADNGVLYFSGAGVEQLKQRGGATGTTSLGAFPLSSNVKSLTDEITPRQYEACCGQYILPLKNYYFSFDTDDENRADTTIVLSTHVKGAISQYTLPTTYEYGVYEDDDGVLHYLLASASSGQMIEFETGFDDLGQAIYHELKTKEWDFGAPGTWKDFQFVDVFGLMTEGGTIDVEILADGTVVSSGQITDTNLNLDSEAVTIGSHPIGEQPIGGGGDQPTVSLFPFVIRIPVFGGGTTVQVKMSSETAAMQWTLDRMTLTYENNTFDIFPSSNIA